MSAIERTIYRNMFAIEKTTYRREIYRQLSDLLFNDDIHNIIAQYLIFCKHKFIDDCNIMVISSSEERCVCCQYLTEIEHNH